MNQSSCRLHQAMRLYQLIGDIDDCYITDVVDVPKLKGKISWLKVVAIAASVAVVLFSITTIMLASNQVVFPTDNKVYPYPSFTSQQSGNQLAAKKYVDYKGLADSAQAVVCADVIEEYRKKTDKGYLVYVKIKVLKTLKGQLCIGDVLLVEDTGGGYLDENGNYNIVTLYGDPLMEDGNRVLLFLYDINESHSTSRGQVNYAVLGSVGKFFYDVDGKYHWSMLYNKDYPEEYKPTMMLIDDEPKTIEEISREIEE